MDYDKLKNADMVIANLIIEYIDYHNFQKVIEYVNPKYVSCIIQINMEDNWVSESPYLHVFNKLDEIHHQIEENRLDEEMLKIDYFKFHTVEYPLSNGKKLVQIDYEKAIQ